MISDRNENITLFHDFGERFLNERLYNMKRIYLSKNENHKAKSKNNTGKTTSRAALLTYI
ncbi:hypothetical protein MF1_09910 [Bartonella quintana]|nr:hypothetical protein MF1_09910 [Bartonella quintana]